MSAADLLREVGEALYGPHARTWQGELASALDINIRTVQRWASGDGEPVAGVWGDIVFLVRAKQNNMLALVDRLMLISNGVTIRGGYGDARR